MLQMALQGRESYQYASEETILLVFCSDVTMGHARRFGWGSSSSECCRGDVFGGGV